MTENFEQYQLNVIPLREYSSLSSDWLFLEQKSEASFFLSWSWVGTWLECYSHEVDVLRVTLGDDIVGLCLLTKSVFTQWQRFTSNRLHFHQTGSAELDQVWIEYNGVLCATDHDCNIHALVMPFLVKHYPDWDELVVGAVSRAIAETLQKSSGLSRLDLWYSPSYGVDLKNLNTKNIDFLESLSRNSRYQIRRSLRMYERQGGIRLKFAENEAEAQSFFHEIAPLHMEKWGEKAGESGFSNPAFMSFHNLIIKTAFPLNQVDVIKVFCGERVLGYLYNFLYRGRVYFYLSGLVSEQDSKLKPGLCAHTLLIQHYMENGYDFYDFMGGKDRYKSSLGQVHEELFQIALQKDCLKFKVEKILREVKRRFIS
tara:strand:- start:36813 stop:37922 length:1110 start_codon:yes stop_codon:yes gene_type:complete